MTGIKYPHFLTENKEMLLFTFYRVLQVRTGAQGLRGHLEQKALLELWDQ